MGVEAPTAEQVDNALNNSKYQGSAYLDEVNAVKEEIHQANRQGRKPDLSDFHPTALEAAGVKVKEPKAKVEKPKEPAKKVAKKTVAKKVAKKAPAKKSGK